MIEIIDKVQCSGCYACANICPKDCLKMVLDEEGFWYPKIEENKCINCNLCKKVCPIIKYDNKDKFIGSNLKKEVYAAQNLNEEVRKNSSSGGIFSLLAESVIEKDGIVIGAVFNENLEVVHKIIQDKKEIEKLRGSKYVQSKIGNVYREIKNQLEKNKLVFFTGTPCQISGLKSYLNKEYNNLITQDIVCHGVPSPIVWGKYKKYISNKNKKSIKDIFFRSKNEGWRRYSLKFVFEGNKSVTKNIEEDLYLISFQNDINLRPSCYDCKFKGERRESDITLADFWGIENTNINLDDDKGTSLVIINTEKGKNLFYDNIPAMRLVKTDMSNGIKGNKSYHLSANRNSLREKFLLEINEQNFEKKVRKYCNYTYRIQLRKAIKKQAKLILNHINLKNS
ncbi:Coenzyme F420 hydrogenase/dehydrogenase, beta subunit C-terminal domain [Clostridium baratii]